MVTMLATTSCSPSRPALGPAPASAAEFRFRAQERFGRVWFWKPHPQGSTPFDLYMAPLLYQELPAYPDDHFGAVSGTRSATKIDSSRPTLYYSVDAVQVFAKPTKRLSFVWFYPRGPGLAVQGLRMTLDETGQPAIFEPLASRSALHPIYVSKTLEEAVAQANGGPLPGRKFAIEARADLRPDIVLVNTIGQGPMPSGPYCYLRRSSHEISNIHCRCDPSRTGKPAIRYYDLVPLADLPPDLRPTWPTSPTPPQGSNIPPALRLR